MMVRENEMVALKNTLKTFFIAGSILFMAVFVWKNVEQIDQLPSDPDYYLLILSIFVNWAGFLSVIAIWMFLLRTYGERLKAGQAYRIYFRSNLGKYLPGKLWQLAGMVFLCSELGIRPQKSLAASLYNTGIAVLTGLSIFVLTAPIDIKNLEDGRHWHYLLAPVILLVCIYPNFLTRAMNFGLGILGKEKITEGIGRAVLFLSILFYSLAWIIFGWSFHLFLGFLGFANGLEASETIGIFAGSVTLGFLAFFSPGGIGVREGVIVFFLKEYVPLSTAVFVSVSARLWITAVEIIGFSTTYLMKRNIPEKNEKNKTI